MKGDLVTYLTNQYYKNEQIKSEPGPVITISREYGCPAKIVAEKLNDLINTKLSSRGSKERWKWISKEILSEAAQELSMQPEEISYVFDYEQKGILDDILSSHSRKYYKSDRKIRQTVANVIRSFAVQGNVIIVGRGGVVIAKDIPLSLHINLEAPLEWRAVRTAAKYQLSLEQARKTAIETDKKRQEFREYFAGKGSDYTRFDLSINCMTLSVDEISQLILKTAEIRKLI
jgi:cytidylate kinase